MSNAGQLMAYNKAYGQNDPISPMTPQEIEAMRGRLLNNISDLNGNKNRINPDMYHQLLNYHHYALTILDNMKITRMVEMADPYNNNIRMSRNQPTSFETINPYTEQLKAVYGKDGKMKFVDPKGKVHPKLKGEWENQFDEGVYAPPCYSVPPSNVWGKVSK